MRKKKFSKCYGCVFADWELTKKGKLHPKGNGQCRWKKKIILPISSAHYERFKDEISGGYIWRFSERSDVCECREENKQ